MSFDYQHIPNIESLPWGYFCSVCQLLINPNETLQSMCGHLYCKPCLAYVTNTTMACPYDGYLVTQTDAKPLMESNKVMADTIGQTAVYCLYRNSGCTWLGSLSASSLHCSGCAFGNSLVICSWCGIQTAHRNWEEHAQSCFEMHQVQMHAYMEASVAMATSQANAQVHGVAAAMLTQEQWYQQPYASQWYYENGYNMHQQPLHLQSLALQHHVNVQPAVHYVAQTHSQMQVQPQLQSQSSVLHQPYTVFPSAPHLEVASVPQAYLSVPPHPQHPSLAFPAFQGLQNQQAQAHFQTAPISQTHYLQNAQVPQHQQFHGHGQTRSQLEIQNPVHPQANNVQTTPSKNTTGQSQSNQPHAYWTGQKMHHQPHQTNQLGAPPHHMPVYHQVGTQAPQVHNHFPQLVPHVYPPQFLPTVQKQESSLPQQHTTDVVHNQTHQGGPSYNPHRKVQQPLTPILGFQPQVNYHYASASNVSSGQAAPNFPSVEEADIQRTQNQIPQASWGDEVALNHIFGKQGDEPILDGSEARSTTDSINTAYGMNLAVEGATHKFDHELDSCAESLHKSNILVEDNEIKSEHLGKQVMKENVANGRKNLGKCLRIERKGTEDSLSLIRQHYLMSPDHLQSEERSGASSSGSLDRGYDQRSLVRPHVKHEPDLELRPTSRFSQPSIDLGERHFRRGPRNPISEHLGMPSHGYGSLDHGLGGSRAEKTDTEGRYRFGLLRSEFKSHGNLQMREKVQDADMTRPVDSNGIWTGDVGFRNRYTLQGSSPGGKESFPNSRKRATMDPIEGLDFHSQAKEHQPKPKSMDAKKLKIDPAVSSSFCNQNKNEERRSGSLG